MLSLFEARRHKLAFVEAEDVRKPSRKFMRMGIAAEVCPFSTGYDNSKAHPNPAFAIRIQPRGWRGAGLGRAQQYQFVRLKTLILQASTWIYTK